MSVTFSSFTVLRPSLTIHVWLGIVANNDGVHKESQKRVLVVRGIVLEESSRV